MLVRELIRLLQEADPDNIVVMSKDAEGNGYSPLAHVYSYKMAYRPETTWSGEIGYSELTPEIESHGYTEEDVIDGEPATILWPTN